MIKALYFLFSLGAGLTIGVVLASVLAVITFFQSLINFPIAVYLRSVQNYNSSQQEREPTDVWERHIARMEKKKQQYKDHEKA
tara:strand:- start:453 stop:701 length:249 start_codon:yes stop_codon:yes gene_type:complete